jgi:hypothetical protein
LLCSLRIGERVVSLSNDGLLVAEYVLFDPAEAVLHATDPVSVREAGYMTTAAKALERLAREGVTPELAEDAANALGRETVLAYGRGEWARELGGRRLLGPNELFDGAVFRATTRVYEGVWLDLRALSRAMAVPDAPLLLQSLHLAAALTEVEGTTPLHLSTAGATRERRPAERTFQRPTFDAVGNVPDVLRQIAPPATPVTVDVAREARLQPALLARVRERLAAETTIDARTRLSMIERALAARTAMPSPMGDEELRAVERQIDSGDPTGLNEAALGAARTWLAAGEDAHARHFAHQLVDDPSAGERQRLVALEILDTTPETKRSSVPPPPGPEAVQVSSLTPRPQRFPGLGNVPAPGLLPPALSIPPPPTSFGTGQPAGRTQPRYDPELVESLELPLGSSEEDLAPDQRPANAAEARVAMIRLARDLARDYRLWYGRTLRCDIHAIDLMQQHLLSRFTGAPIDDTGVAWELRRHGALLSEIVARALGGFWADVGPSEPGYWVMTVPPALRTCPIGRVYRFVALGRRERDLVSHFLALEGAARRGA